MKKYNLIWLDHNIRHNGITQKCFKYSISENKDCIHIAYLDYLFQEQYIAIFRTSRLCYRIYYNGEMKSKRTCEEATRYLNEILNEVIKNGEHYNVMTVAELNQLNRITYQDKMKIYRRSDKK